MKALLEFILSLFSSKKVEARIESQPEIEPEIVAYEEEIEKEVEEKVVEFIPIAYKNESERLKKEFTQLASKNTVLYDMLIDINEFANREFGKGVLITMIYRKQSEQDYLYRNSAKYAKRKFKSPHQFWHAVDLRSRTFTAEEIARMVEYINYEYDDVNYYKFSADYHEVGKNGLHFHLQFAAK